MVMRILVGSSVVVIAISSIGRSSLPEAAGLGGVPAPNAAPQSAHATSKPAADDAVDAQAREIEQKMTEDERFSLIISLIGPVPSIGVPRDKRIPADVKNTSAGYTPGIPRLGIPALQSSDASMGV